MNKRKNSKESIIEAIILFVMSLVTIITIPIIIVMIILELFIGLLAYGHCSSIIVVIAEILVIIAIIFIIISDVFMIKSLIHHKDSYIKSYQYKVKTFRCITVSIVLCSTTILIYVINFGMNENFIISILLIAIDVTAYVLVRWRLNRNIDILRKLVIQDSLKKREESKNG